MFSSWGRSIRDYLPKPPVCRICGAEMPSGTMHYCGGLPYSGGAAVVGSLTEADVRRIVREELRAQQHGAGQKL